MCQVDEDYDSLLERHVVASDTKKCNKCKETTAALILKPGETFCRCCFKDHFVHKFRAMLGKNRIIFPGEKVLLAVSGGSSSCAMLNQVQQGLSQKAHKKLRFKPGIVYIDEGCVLGQSLEERQKTMAQIQSLFKRAGFPYHIIPLEMVLNLPSSVLEPVHVATDDPAGNYKVAVDHFMQTNPGHFLDSNTQVDQSEPSRLTDGTVPQLIDEAQTQILQELFSMVKTLTAKEDLLHTLRRHVLVSTARAEGYSKLMLGENCTRLAVKLLANIAMGRGAQLAVDTAFSDPRYGDIVAVRPMRDYTAKEISLYNYMCNVPSVFIPSLETKTTDKSSIQRLTESFVVKLQGDFPSTVSTIYRQLQTANFTEDIATASLKCLLCMCTLETTLGETSAFQATLISEQLSQHNICGITNVGTTTPMQGMDKTLKIAHLRPDAQTQCCFPGDQQDGEEQCVENAVCCSHFKGGDSMNLESFLCYSCQQTVKDMTSVKFLPQYIMSEAQRRNRR
ncbi:Cytoplasmic tRNA 2-thiolation protein 2 [Merluccius polli]|uniref:Cytoplasmic tRNA 2-thiolation protein 2 n=1 Tax=Merluccius polli TaxID=89951 RepID=A0AA47MP30_MERPO|nr:Cytoplasmic tRNA 2-thiolation protein 2 [Merluccius polli]